MERERPLKGLIGQQHVTMGRQQLGLIGRLVLGRPCRRQRLLAHGSGKEKHSFLTRINRTLIPLERHREHAVFADGIGQRRQPQRPQAGGIGRIKRCALLVRQGGDIEHDHAALSRLAYVAHLVGALIVVSEHRQGVLQVLFGHASAALLVSGPLGRHRYARSRRALVCHSKSHQRGRPAKARAVATRHKRSGSAFNRKRAARERLPGRFHLNVRAAAQRDTARRRALGQPPRHRAGGIGHRAHLVAPHNVDLSALGNRSFESKLEGGKLRLGSHRILGAQHQAPRHTFLQLGFRNAAISLAVALPQRPALRKCLAVEDSSSGRTGRIALSALSGRVLYRSQCRRGIIGSLLGFGSQGQTQAPLFLRERRRHGSVVFFIQIGHIEREDKRIRVVHAAQGAALQQHSAISQAKADRQTLVIG